MRHLTREVTNEFKKEAIGRVYLEDFYDSIEMNLEGNIIRKEDDSIIYIQPFFDYEGIKEWLHPSDYSHILFLFSMLKISLGIFYKIIK